MTAIDQITQNSPGVDLVPTQTLTARTRLLLGAVSLIGIISYLWPFLLGELSKSSEAHVSDAPLIFVVLIPLLLAVVVSEMSSGGLDAKAVAYLGVLAAAGAALRVAGAGVSGFEATFFLLIPAGRVFGKAFGFVLGCTLLFVSALLTGGIGPWLPFQMLAAAWIGFGAGSLPRAQGRHEVWMLTAYGVVVGLAYGVLLNLWFWPWAVGMESGVSYVAGDSPQQNLSRYLAFYTATSLGWDIPRAFTNAVLMLIAGAPLLRALRRSARRGSFGVTGSFHAQK